MVNLFRSSSSGCGGQPRARSQPVLSATRRGTPHHAIPCVGGGGRRSLPVCRRCISKQQTSRGLKRASPPVHFRTVCAKAKFLQPTLPDPRISVCFCPFPFPLLCSLIVPSIHFTHLFHSFVHPSRATPRTMGRPSAVWVTELQPELRNSAARPTYLLFLSLPPAESCQVGTGFPYSFLPFTRTTDSIFLSRVHHSACGFEHSLSGYQSPGDAGDT